MFLSLEITVTMATSPLLVACRSDSDSEGENPEKKKLQEQLMGTLNVHGLFCRSRALLLPRVQVLL